MSLPTRHSPRLPALSAFAGFRFLAEVIAGAARWSFRYNPSYRHVEELLVERGVEVDHVSVFRWDHAANPAPERPGAGSVTTGKVAAIVDRLTFDAHIIETGSDFYRLKTTRQRRQKAA
jgi:hypothetical protein